MSSSGAFERWLLRFMLLLMASLLGLCCYLVWRVSMVVLRVEQSVAAATDGLCKVTDTASRISEKVDALIVRMDRLEAKSRDAVGVDDMEGALDELAVIRKGLMGHGELMQKDAERQIDYLLNIILSSKGGFSQGSRRYSPLTFYAYMLGKYKLYQGSLTTAEDFIDKVGTKPIVGAPYRVVLDENTTVPLREWLTDALAEYRAKKEAGSEPAPTP